MVEAAKAPSIFASRAFRQYFIGQSLSLLGDGLRTLAVPLLAWLIEPGARRVRDIRSNQVSS